MGLLDTWYAYFENWGFLKTMLERQMLFSDETLARAPHHVATFLLVGVVCYLLTFVTHPRKTAESWGLTLGTGATALATLIILRFGSTNALRSIIWTIQEVIDGFRAIGQPGGNLAVDIFEAVGMLLVSPLNLVMQGFILFVPAVLAFCAAVDSVKRYGLWAPIAFVGDIAIGSLLIAAVGAGIFHVIAYILTALGPFVACIGFSRRFRGGNYIDPGDQVRVVFRDQD